VTHRDGPILLNVRRFLDMPEVVAMATERVTVECLVPPEVGRYASLVSIKLGW
jgi:hypothetical protein